VTGSTSSLAANVGAVLSARWAFRHAELGAKVRLRGRPRVHNTGRLIIGDRARIVSTPHTLELAAIDGGVLAIGPQTFVNYGGSIAASRSVLIGARCLIGTHAIIMDNDFHRLEPERRYELPESRPIVIEDNVWIGARVIVLGGVTIGEGSCIGAGSVVAHDIPPRSLAVGVPARVIRAL
jgi:acetyltransferase-like isoleucine patch superfamily enzyme